ncbi:FliM/FliN family flagellar motor C-terminal domain-containing protein [Novosphingobium beihaiensis]|uniref:FliM/FliN family flagellar motor switch protein n=1 Tax=Novosphingobium beihaiensis TaxID=2930389 RepID=A0ABT0BPR6_9SPHN|nr:FliM/FliN family flagellar motor switch protein [Novosphingobium beihaiensis]MCJ2186983.1 FliM/FliN family flagellar motor switch protein [Novosphingobium beihaiensis]
MIKGKERSKNWPKSVKHDRSICVRGYDDRAVAARMLGVEIDDAALTASDRRLVAAMAERAIGDLERRLADLEGEAQSQACGAPDWRALVRTAATGGDDLLEIVCREDWLVRYAKRCVQSVPSHGRLVYRREALSQQPVTVSMALARTVAELGELAQLEPGDIFLFDEGAENHSRIVIDGVRQGDAPCTLVERDGQYFLRLDREKTAA